MTLVFYSIFPHNNDKVMHLLSATRDTSSRTRFRCLRKDVDDETSRSHASKSEITFHNYSCVSVKETWEINCDKSQMRNRTRRDAGHFKTRMKSFGERETPHSSILHSLSKSPSFSIVCLMRLTCSLLYTVVHLGVTQTTLLFDPIQPPSQVIACIAVL